MRKNIEGNEMDEKATILMAEDDEGHVTLIKRNLRRSGITNRMHHFKDGQETLDFIFRRGKGPHWLTGTGYLLLLDLRMPKVNGVEVLKQIKKHHKLRKMPVIIVTTADNPADVEKCKNLGCHDYITKPVDYKNFVETIRKLGNLLMAMEIPTINW